MHCLAARKTAPGRAHKDCACSGLTGRLDDVNPLRELDLAALLKVRGVRGNEVGGRDVTKRRDAALLNEARSHIDIVSGRHGGKANERRRRSINLQPRRGPGQKNG